MSTNRVLIVSGNFTGKKNYSGYDEDGNRYFIPSRLMQANKWESDADVKLPFWCKGVKERTVDMLEKDATGKLVATGEKITRTQAGSIFKTDADLIASAVANSLVDIEIARQIREKATTAGLSAETVTALETSSVF